MNKRYESLKRNNMINFIWLVLSITSISIAIISTLIMVLAVSDTKILSWTIGYILTSGTNDTIRTPSIIFSATSIAVFVLCMLKNQLLKLWIKLHPSNISIQK